MQNEPEPHTSYDALSNSSLILTSVFSQQDLLELLLKAF